MELSTTHYNIIDTGSAIVPDGEYLEFIHGNLRFRFVFSSVEDPQTKQKNTSITGKLIGEEPNQTLQINVINYNSLFTTPSRILEVGELSGKALFVLFSVVTISSQNENGTKIFHYTWYTEK